MTNPLRSFINFLTGFLARLAGCERMIHAVVAVALALTVHHGFEIGAYAGSIADDAWYQRKSLAPGNNFADVGPIKELCTPLFMALVRHTGIPLHVVYVLLLALGAHLLFRELRAWSWPAAGAWGASLAILVVPSQIHVMVRSTSDPLAAILTLLVLCGSLAIARSKAAWVPVITASTAVALGWLNRPEGILLALPVAIAIGLGVAGRRPGGRPWLHWRSDWRTWGALAAPMVAMLVAAWVGTSAFNQSHYGFFAPTVMKAKPMQRAMKALMAIDDGTPAQPYRPLSLRAMALAEQASPAFARSSAWWATQLHGDGWSNNGMQGYRADDGSVSGGYLQWALLDCSRVTAGAAYPDRLAWLGAVAQDLETATARGTLPHRWVASPTFGPAFSPFSAGYRTSLEAVGMAIIAAEGHLEPVIDDRGQEWRDLADHACNRRSWLNESPSDQARMSTLHGWIVFPRRRSVPDLLGVEGDGASLVVASRPDVEQVEFGHSATPANCGFTLTMPQATAGHLLAGDGNVSERIPLAGLAAMHAKSGQDFGQAFVYLDAVDTSGSAEPRQTVSPRRLAWLRLIASDLARFAVLAVPLVSFATLALYIIPATRRRIPQVVEVFTFIALACIIPRWLVLSAIDAEMFPAFEERYLFPASLVLWAWCAGLLAAGLGAIAAKAFPRGKSTA